MKVKKLVAFVLVGIMSVSMISGCGKKETQKANSTTDIEVSYWNSGLGTDWLDAMIAGFEEKYPQYNVEYTASASVGGVNATWGMEETDTKDLYLSIKNHDFGHMEPLDDMLDSTLEGDSVTLRECINPSYLAYETAEDGHVYTLTYGGGLLGFVYNEKLFEEAGIKQLPRTTDELAFVCGTLYKKGITPLCHFLNGSYYDWISEAFFSQYNGMDYYLNTFYKCKDETGDTLSLELFTKKDGRYEALKAYEKIVTPEFTLSGSNTSEHTYMQTEFISGKCAMMVNGSWMSNEMESVGGADNFRVMKLPVLSAITDNLETVKKESELRKVIGAVDDVTDGVKTIDSYKQGDMYVIDGLSVSEADWNKVYSARNTAASNYSGQSAFIPKYSNAKEGAKEFLKYLYSEEGQKIYTDALKISLPLAKERLSLDTSKWNSFEQSMYDLLKKTENFATHNNSGKHKIFIDGGAASFAKQIYITGFCTKNAEDRVSADEAWKKITDIIEREYKETWLPNIQ